MSFCHNCGFELPEGVLTCPDCGAHISAGGYAQAAYAQGEHEQSAWDNIPESEGSFEQDSYQGDFQNSYQSNARQYGQDAHGEAPNYSSYRRQWDDGSYTPPQPAYSYAPVEKKPDRVLGTGAFFASSLLMSIPVVGFIFQIIWSLGGTGSLNRRNMARARLIATVIKLFAAALLVWISVSYLYPLLMELLETYPDLIGEIFS